MDTFIEFGNIIISFVLIVGGIFAIVVCGQIGLVLGLALIIYSILMLFQTEKMKNETIELVEEGNVKEATKSWSITFVFYIILSFVLFLVFMSVIN